jgi:hypothetical protein
VANNFTTFLYYTPDEISEQTVAYLNYIISYLQEFKIESGDDADFKSFLVEEMYLHIMTYKGEDNLSKGTLLLIF